MRAALVVTGTEVLEGRVRDENGAFVAASLAAAGVSVDRITVVGDGLEEIRALRPEGPRDLGWRPAENFQSGIEKTVRWYLDNTAWTARVTSGAYRDWVAQHYSD